MKFLVSTFGVAAVRVSNDAVMPLKGAVVKDIVDGIGRHYEFSAKPPLQLVMQGQNVTFQGGALNREEQRIGIIQLALVPNGDFVMAQTTEQADIVVSDLINFLDEKFSYRYKSAEQKRLYYSNVVVEFERDFGSKFELFAKIENLLNQGNSATPPRFQFKRLGFGQGDPVQPILSIETMETADFAIERRGGQPYSSNTFFCSAPMQTQEHLDVLEKLEKLF